MLFSQKSLAFNPAMLRPGAAPPKRELDSSAVTFEEPADVRTLESANKVRRMAHFRYQNCVESK